MPVMACPPRSPRPRPRTRTRRTPTSRRWQGPGQPWVRLRGLALFEHFLRGHAERRGHHSRHGARLAALHGDNVAADVAHLWAVVPNPSILGTRLDQRPLLPRSTGRFVLGYGSRPGDDAGLPVGPPHRDPRLLDFDRASRIHRPHRGAARVGQTSPSGIKKKVLGLRA